MKLLAIDGNSIMNRAFYAIKMLSNKKGMFTNAIFGFMNIYLKNIDEFKPDAVVAAFDMKAPTFRHKAVSTYKANRKGMPDELFMQMPVIKELLKDIGAAVIEKEGYEADDILGTISRLCTEQNCECHILTGDRDSLQLINKNVSVRLATTKETIIFNTDKFIETYGFEPIKLIDLKALMGDSSDNISGVTGIGEKTATDLIQKYGTIENLYENLDEKSFTKSVFNKLSIGKESAEQSKWLATIDKNVPISETLSDCVLKPIKKQETAALLNELEMFKLTERLDLNSVEIPDVKPVLPQSLAEISEKEIDEDSLIMLISLEKTLDYIYTNKKLSIILDNTVYFTENDKIILDFLQSSASKRTFDAKPSYKLMFEAKKALKKEHRHLVDVRNITFDAYIAGYLLNSVSSTYSVERLCGEYRVHYRSDCDDNADIASLSALCDILSEQIKETGMTDLLTEIEQPLTEVLASMETDGITIDKNGVQIFGTSLKSEISALETQIYKYAGKEFNISSPKQLGIILFEDLGLPSKKKTKTGFSTNAEILEGLRDSHPIIELILQYRQLTKLNSTYVEGLLKVAAKDEKIHSSFNQTETRTGRISSTEPNMQNIPVRTELGSQMRKFFTADKGYILLDADYSQIELRILASVCGDKNMQEAFRTGNDIHTATAAQVFNMPIEMVTPSMRRAAKAVNFGIIYGIGAFSLSKDIGVSVAEADSYIKGYLNNYPNVQKYMDETVDSAVKNGYVTTIFGRRRYIPELSATNKMIQAFGKRAAMNAPIQGSAADIIKIAMVKVFKRIRDEKLDARLILQVHDELIIEASEKDAEKASLILREEMENAAHLDVPLTAEVNRGRSWYDAKG